jgi:hypothetical protein
MTDIQFLAGGIFLFATISKLHCSWGLPSLHLIYDWFSDAHPVSYPVHGVHSDSYSVGAVGHSFTTISNVL